MDKLNLPEADLRITRNEEISFVYDIVRRKNIQLNPEEWVRQHFLHYLINHLEYPVKLIKVESAHHTTLKKRRTDIITYDNSGNPALLIECKEPGVKIDRSVLNQVIRYNSVIRSRYIVVTNGTKHYCAQFHPENENYSQIDTIPSYREIKIS